MDRLEMPAVRAGLEVHRHDRTGEQVQAGTLRTVLGGPVTPGVAERPVDQAELGVDRRMQPRGGAAGLPGVAFPGVVADLTWTGCTPEVPDDLAVAGVDGEAGAAVAVVRAAVEPAVVVSDGDLLHVAEAGDLLLPQHLAGLLTQRDDPAAAAVGEDHALADRDAPAGQRASGLAVDPFRGPGGAVHGEYVAHRRLDVEDTVDRHRGALVGARGEAALDPVDPGGAELSDVVAPDPVQPRVVLVAEVAANLGKVLATGNGAARWSDGRRLRGSGHALRQRDAGHRRGRARHEVSAPDRRHFEVTSTTRSA
jgi:hypothetical protein